MKGILTTLVLGAALAEFGLTGLENKDDNAIKPEEQAAAVYERIVPISAYGAPLGMASGSNAGIDQHIDAGVRQLDSGVRKIPGYAIKVAESVEQHGIAALAYENPEMKQAGREIGREIGAGIHQFAMALGKDMVATSRESGLRGRSLN